MLIPEINYEYALEVGFEGIKFGPGKYGEFSAAPTVDLTMASTDLNKRHLCDLATVSRENEKNLSRQSSEIRRCSFKDISESSEIL